MYSNPNLGHINYTEIQNRGGKKAIRYKQF